MHVFTTTFINAGALRQRRDDDDDDNEGAGIFVSVFHSIVAARTAADNRSLNVWCIRTRRQQTHTLTKYTRYKLHAITSTHGTHAQLMAQIRKHINSRSDLFNYIVGGHAKMSHCVVVVVGLLTPFALADSD